MLPRNRPQKSEEQVSYPSAPGTQHSLDLRFDFQRHIDIPHSIPAPLYLTDFHLPRAGHRRTGAGKSSQKHRKGNSGRYSLLYLRRHLPPEPQIGCPLNVPNPHSPPHHIVPHLTWAEKPCCTKGQAS